MIFPPSKICTTYSIAVAYAAYVSAAGFLPVIARWGHKWRVTI